MTDEYDGSTAFTALTTYTQASSIFDTTVFNDSSADNEEEEESREDYSSLVPSKPGHLLPIDSNHLERHLDCGSQSQHVDSSIIAEFIREARDDGNECTDFSDFVEQMEARDVMEPGAVSSTSSRGSKPKQPTDSYMESLHKRLESTHFHRDEKNEDFIDFLFEKIELVACEMDGEKETLRDILDDTFEFLEDVTCGRTSQRRNASIRASFERFLQSIDKLAAIYPKKEKKGNNLKNKDLLDALCDYFENVNCKGRASNMVGSLLEYISPCTSATTSATSAAANVATKVAKGTARGMVAPFVDNKDEAFSLLMSISEETGELQQGHFSTKLPKISEEYSLVSGSSRSRSLRRVQVKHPKISPQQLQDELSRRSNFKRMRSNIHVNVSRKSVVDKMVEAKETVEEAFEAAGDQLCTIFENMEMGIWDMLVLGAASNADTNSRREVTTDRPAGLWTASAGEVQQVTTSSEPPTEPANATTPKTSLVSRSRSSSAFSTEGVQKVSSMSTADSHEYRDSIDARGDSALIHATSSEETYASGGSARHKGLAAKRHKMVVQMEKVGKNSDLGRLTPNSHVTGSTCDETVSSSERGSPADADRELRSVPSSSMHLERMEMVTYMSIHARSSPTELKDSENSSERSRRASSLGAMVKDDRSSWIPTSLGLYARLEETPRETSYSAHGPGHHDASMSMSGDEQQDNNLGKASNRTNRSVLNTSSLSTEEAAANPCVTTNGEDVPVPNVPGIDVATIPYVPTIEERPSISHVASIEHLASIKELPSIPHEPTTGESFITAKQSLDFSELEALISAVSRKAAVRQSRRLKMASNQAVFEALEDFPDDELHRATGRKDTPRPPLPESFVSKGTSESQSMAPVEDSSSSWATLFNAILHGTLVGGGWVGKQAIKIMVMLLFISASTAVTANGAWKEKFQERRRQFDEKMRARESDIPIMEATIV